MSADRDRYGLSNVTVAALFMECKGFSNFNNDLKLGLSFARTPIMHAPLVTHCKLPKGGAHASYGDRSGA